MKKFLTILILTVMTLLMATGTLGAVSNNGKTYSATDTWFYIEPERPYFEGYFEAVNNNNDESLLGGEYYVNDHYFGDVYYKNINGDTYLDLKGSFLFDNDFFIGLNLYSETESGLSSQTVQISPGYCWRLDRYSYVAVSADYVSKEYNDELAGFEVDGKIYGESSKLTGNVYIPRNGDLITEFQGNFQVTEDIVAGGRLFNSGSTYEYFAGLTNIQKPNILDFKFGKYTNEVNNFQLSGMHYEGKLGIGCEYYKEDPYPDGLLTLKIKYTIEKSHVVFKYNLENNTYPSSMSLAYEMTLK